MLEFNTTLELNTNTELLELIKDFTYTINKGITKRMYNFVHFYITFFVHSYCIINMMIL